MKTFLLTTALASSLALTATAMEHDHSGHAHHDHQHHHAHDSHHHHGYDWAGVMGDHQHPQGEWMFSYSVMRMNMSGLMRGNDDVTITDVNGSAHMVAPLNMTMDMHMLGAMYGVTDNFTLMAMGHYHDLDMDHQRRNGTRFQRNASGLGDTELYGLYQLPHNLRVGLGISLPTGSIDEKDPNGNNLPYPMQLGSGTFDVIPSLTYTANTGDYHYGAQVKADIRTGRNDNSYRLGNIYEAQAFGAYQWRDDLSFNSRLQVSYRDNIEGADPNTLGSGMVPTADPNQQARFTTRLFVGAVYEPAQLRGAKLNVEAGLPIYQNVRGFQLQEDASFQLRLTRSF